MLKVLVNVLLEFSFNGGDINIELYKISIECVVVIVQKFVVLLLEVAYIAVEFLKDGSNSFKVMFFKSSELLDCSKKFNKFVNSSAEQIEFTENLIR